MKKLSALILALVLAVDTHAGHACMDEVHIVLPVPHDDVDSGRIVGACEAGIVQVVIYNFHVPGDRKVVDCADLIARLNADIHFFALAPPPNRTAP